MAARPDTAPDGKSSRPATRRDDLERYGVWVKAEPQDITPEPELTGSAGESLDLPEESFLTEEEERLLGSFEDVEPASDNPSGERRASAKTEEDIFSSLPEIEDFEPSLPEVAATEPKEKSDEDLEFELSMEDLSSGFQESEIGPATHIDLDAVEGLDSASPKDTEDFGSLPDIDLPEESGDFDVPVAEARPEAKGSSSAAIEDVSAEFLDGDFTSSESPAVESGTAHDVTDEFLMSEEPAPAAVQKESPEQDFEPLDIELHFDDDTATTDQVDHASAGFEEVGEFDGMLDSKAETPEFDDLAALERELGGAREEEAVGAAPQAQATRGMRAPSQADTASSGLANELLLKIANELSSIRSELVTLKSQLSVPHAAEHLMPVEEAAESQPDAESSGGFFDEEDDEKIALTGDELDNILSSADFTEEPSAELAGFEGEVPAVEEPESPSATDAILDEGILPESGEYAIVEEPVERISLEGAEGEPKSELEEPNDHELIRRLADEGISPLTPAPEDTSYLEEPLEEAEILDISETPFVEAPLVEPDLTDLSIDLGVEDEEVELSGELPVMESSELADITLGIESVEMPSSEEEPLPLEGEVLPEFEDEIAFDDISLAMESESAAEEVAGEELIEELGGESVEFPEEELLHEDKGTPAAIEIEEAVFESPTEAGMASMELDEDLFVPSPKEVEPSDITLSARPPEAGPEEIAAEEFLDEGFEEPLAEPVSEAPTPPRKASLAEPATAGAVDPTEKLKSDIRSVLSYLDRLLESLPEEKIEEFAHSEHFDTYKKLFEELGLV